MGVVEKDKLLEVWAHSIAATREALPQQCGRTELTPDEYSLTSTAHCDTCFLFTIIHPPAKESIHKITILSLKSTLFFASEVPILTYSSTISHIKYRVLALSARVQFHYWAYQSYTIAVSCETVCLSYVIRVNAFYYQNVGSIVLTTQWIQRVILECYRNCIATLKYFFTAWEIYIFLENILSHLSSIPSLPIPPLSLFPSSAMCSAVLRFFFFSVVSTLWPLIWMAICFLLSFFLFFHFRQGLTMQSWLA